MLAGPNPKKRKLNEIAGDNSKMEEAKESVDLKAKIRELEANFSHALNWISVAENHL